MHEPALHETGETVSFDHGYQVEIEVSTVTAIIGAAQTVYPAARHQRCWAHWFRNLEALTPRFTWFERRKFRREFW